MTERFRSASTTGYPSPKMENDFSPRKTMVVLVIVVGCFAVLWPKVFYPMLVGSANQHMKPSPIDKTTGCCDVISDTDVNTIKIMSELCGTIIKAHDEPLSGKELIRVCQKEVLETCGIDISAVLQEQVRLGQSVKQILDEVRSLNGSLCLKYNFGVAPWRLGVPHRVTVKVAAAPSIRQERPLQLKTEMIHPAFRERGRAIPQPQGSSPSRPPPRVVEGRPGPIPGMRPTIGGAGHVVPPSKQGTSSMSIIMPIYTIGIVIFFTYTLMKIIFKKQPEGVGGSLYPPIDPDPHFRREVFESEKSRLGPRLTRDSISSKLVVNAMSALLDEVDQEIEARRKSSEVASQDLANGTLSNGDALKPQDSEEQPSVKVLGMEMTASCEGGKKWSRPDSPVLPTPSPPPPTEPTPPPQEIYLEGALPAQSHLLVSESATEPQPSNTGEDPAVVLAGKMTLSVISLDSSENGEDAEINSQEHNTREGSPAKVVFDPIVKIEENVPVEEVAGEAIDSLIQEAIENIEHGEPIEPQSISLEERYQSIKEQIEKLAAQESLEEEPKPGNLQNEQAIQQSFNLQGSLKSLNEDLEKLEAQPASEVIVVSNREDDTEKLQDLADSVQLESEVANLQELSVEPSKLEEEPKPVNLQNEQDIQQSLNLQGSLKSLNEDLEKLEAQPASEVIVVSNREDDTEKLQDLADSVQLESEVTNLQELSVQPSKLQEDLQKLEEIIEKVDINPVAEEEQKIETAEVIFSDGEDELGSDEEIVDEIEEITYESSAEGSEDEDAEVSDSSNRHEESSALRRVNGEGNEDLVESSKYDTSGAVNDISDEDVSDNEEEVIEIEEVEEEEEEDENNDLNHVSGPSEPENE